MGKQFSMSMYANKADLYQAKAEYYQKRCEELEQSGVGKQACLQLIKDDKNKVLDNLAEKIMAKKLSTISNTIENKIHCLTINNNIDDILELIASMREE